METTQDRPKTPRRRKPAPQARRPATPQARRPAAPAPKGRRPAARSGGAARTAPGKRPPARRLVKKSPAPRPRRRRNPAELPRVVYTPPKPINRGSLLLRLTTVVAVVLALTFGMSLFFKVEVVTVSGAKKYDPWTVQEASGIQVGDNLLSFGEARAAGKIKTALPYVDSVRIGIKLPDTVNIEIKEYDVLYAVRDAMDQWWLITAEGKVVEQTNRASAGERTQILGVKLGSPVPGQNAVAQEAAPVDPEDPTADTTPVTASAADQLSAALRILQAMESCGIIGEAKTVDVSNLGAIELWYGQRFQVKLGDTQQLEYKIACMDSAINGNDEKNSLKDYDSGVLDISFTIKENQVIYQAFD